MTECFKHDPLMDKCFWSMENSAQIAKLMGVAHDELFLIFLMMFVEEVIPYVRVTTLLSGVAKQRYCDLYYRTLHANRLKEESQTDKNRGDSPELVDESDNNLCYYVFQCLRQLQVKV